MIDFLKNWIVGITAASFFLAAVQSLIPQGSVKKVGQLAGGLIILLAIAVPLVKVDFSEFSWIMTEYRMQNSGSDNLLNLENTNMVKKIIEEQTAAYISDKAREIGADCTAEVTYSYTEDGYAYPVSVIVRGELSQSQKEKLAKQIERELIISKANQTYEGVVLDATD